MAATTYVWMGASALLHMAVPLFLKFANSQIMLYVWVLLGSLILNIIVHGILQYQSCGEAFNVSRMFKGAGIGVAITAAMAAVPIYMPGPRQLVSELFFKHQPIKGVSGEACVVDCDKPEPLEPEAYKQQEFAEMRTALGYWAAFAGAYGVGAGGLVSALCG
jgi:hypothetical protein